MRLVSPAGVEEKFRNDYAQSSAGNVVIRYGDMKKQLAEDMVNFMRPIREKAEDIMNDQGLLANIMRTGKEKARTNAAETIDLVRRSMGVKYY